MRLITCQHCKQLFRVHVEKLNGTTHFQCSRCNHTIRIPLAKNRPAGSKLKPTAFIGPKQADQEPSKEKAVRWIDSIRIKIGMILTLVTVLVLFTYIVFNYLTNKHKFTHELNKFAANTSIRLSKTLSGPLWEVDSEQVEDILSSEMLEDQIYAVLVREGDRHTIFQGGTRDAQWKFRPLANNISGHYIVKQENIQWNGKTIGTVEVYVTDKFMIAKSIHAAISMSATAVLLILSLLSTVFFALNKYITRPITKLTNAADQISLGDLSVTIDLRSNDEIGVLGQAFKRMQTSLTVALEHLSHNLHSDSSSVKSVQE